VGLELVRGEAALGFGLGFVFGLACGTAVEVLVGIGLEWLEG
jgi:hypothetical protein